MTPEESKQYRKGIDAMFMDGSSYPISNSDASHAIILLERIFHYARKTVDVFCGNLRKDVYNNEELLAEIRCALNRDVRIRMLVEHVPDNQHIRELQNDFPNNLSICLLNADAPRPFHFTVSDGKAFRFEQDHEGGAAMGCANFPKIARMMEAKFSDLLQEATPLS